MRRYWLRVDLTTVPPPIQIEFRGESLRLGQKLTGRRKLWIVEFIATHATFL